MSDYLPSFREHLILYVNPHFRLFSNLIVSHSTLLSINKLCGDRRWQIANLSSELWGWTGKRADGTDLGWEKGTLGRREGKTCAWDLETLLPTLSGQTATPGFAGSFQGTKQLISSLNIHQINIPGEKLQDHRASKRQEQSTFPSFLHPFFFFF